MSDTSRQRAAALLEVLGVFLTGQFLANLLAIPLVQLGISTADPFATLNAHSTGPELITGAWLMFLRLMLINSGYFLLIIPINWWRRRQGPVAYGLTKAGHSWTTLLLAGLGTAALSTWPVMSVSLANLIHPSQTTPWRQAFFDMSWRRWEFWLFSAVMSWALVPVVEELFFRGYCQRRLAEHWGDGPAIVGTACFFTFAHSQYQIPNLYNAGMIVGLLISALGFGVVFAWTRSLIPGIIAHALIDIPMTVPWEAARVAVLMIGAAFLWRRGLAIIKQVFPNTKLGATVALALVQTVYMIAVSRVDKFVYVAIAMLVVAVMLEAISRRRSRVAQAESASA